MAVNPMDYGSKDVVLDVIKTERARFYDIIDNPDNWHVETRCEGWQVRDLVGHMIDVTEGYLGRWELAEAGKEAPAPLGLAVMGDTLNEGALALRDLSREEAIARLKQASSKMMDTFEALDENAWYNFLVSHSFMGPLPTFFFPAFQIMDYGVHTWDMHWGLGVKDARLDERTAGVLVPYMFILWQYTVNDEAAKEGDIVDGLKADGEWGGQWKVTVKEGQFTHEAVDDLSDCAAVIHFAHPSDLVLTAYQRFQGGEASGDPESVNQVRRLFFTI
jgi:uncharacterized protein (TIGR03083 family)